MLNIQVASGSSKLSVIDILISFYAVASLSRDFHQQERIGRWSIRNQLGYHNNSNMVVKIAHRFKRNLINQMSTVTSWEKQYGRFYF